MFLRITYKIYKAIIIINQSNYIYQTKNKQKKNDFKIKY